MAIFTHRMLFLAAALLAGCGGAVESRLVSHPQMKAPADSAILTGPQLHRLLALYPLNDSLPLTISTKVGEWEGPDSPSFTWRGNPLPLAFWFWLDPAPAHPPTPQEGYYATRRFPVGPQVQALLTRFPGQYWSSRIYLILVNTRTRRVLARERLSEAWGDGGASYYQDAHIRRLPDGSLLITSSHKSCTPRDENLKWFTCTDSSQTLRLRHGKVIRNPRVQVSRKDFPG